MSWQDLPCKPYLGYIHEKSGYGLAYNPKTGRTTTAHKVAWEKVNGVVPEELQLDHLCRNRACTEVAHLEPVTRKVNSNRGMKTRFQEDDVLVMRHLREQGMTYTALGKMYATESRYVRRLVLGERGI